MFILIQISVKFVFKCQTINKSTKFQVKANAITWSNIDWDAWYHKELKN